MSVLIYAIVSLACFAFLLYGIAEYLTRRYTSIEDLKYINDPRKHAEKGKHAVVMGGSIAGLMTARILLDHFQHVTIVEYDDYDKPEERVRSSVAQGAHAHLMLAIASTTLKTMFGGLENMFKARGGRVSDLGVAMRWFYWASYRVRCTMDYPFWCSTRPFLDRTIREYFFEHYADNVTVLTHRRILNPILSSDLPSLVEDITLLNKSKNGVPITGWYSNASMHVSEDEFRLVGIHIKQRPLETNAGSSDLYDTQATSTDNVKTETYVSNVAIPGTQEAKNHTEQYILGDLIVDCTGATSLLEKWCKSKWDTIVPLSEIKATSMYVSQLFEEPEDFKADWICNPTYPLPGESTRFGYVMRVENNLWQVTGMATAGDTVPNTSTDDFKEHFNALDHPNIYEMLTTPSASGKLPQPVPGEKLHTYVPKVYVRRHYEMVDTIPDGFVGVGNTLCVFDPMYGQGMSGACIAALALNRVLCQSEYQGATGILKPGLGQVYFKTVADRLEFPWMLCAGEDSRWAPRIKMQGPRAPEKPYFLMKFLKFWIRQGMILAEEHPLAQSTAMGIMNMTLSFTSLLNPPLVYLVVKNVLLEQMGMTVTPEERYHKEILPAKSARLSKKMNTC